MYHQSPSRHRYIAFPEHLFMERDTHLWLFGRWRTKEAQMKLTIPAILITALMVAPPAALAQRGGLTEDQIRYYCSMGNQTPISVRPYCGRYRGGERAYPERHYYQDQRGWSGENG